MADPARAAMGLPRGAGVLLAVFAFGASPSHARDVPSPARVAADVVDRHGRLAHPQLRCRSWRRRVRVGT